MRLSWLELTAVFLFVPLVVQATPRARDEVPERKELVANLRNEVWCTSFMKCK